MEALLTLAKIALMEHPLPTREIEEWRSRQAKYAPRYHTVNVDFIRFKYVVLAKYLHMSIFEFYLLIKQHSLILCKNLLWLLF